MENIKDFIDSLTPENFIEKTKQFRDFRNYDKNKDIIKLIKKIGRASCRERV